MGLKKSTRAKQISIIVDISIRIGKDWSSITKSDVDGLIRTIIDEFGDNLGGETETTRDYKKCLKPFFRWFKLGTRDFREASDPPELKSIHMKNVKDKIGRNQTDYTRPLESLQPYVSVTKDHRPYAIERTLYQNWKRRNVADLSEKYNLILDGDDFEEKVKQLVNHFNLFRQERLVN